MTIEFTKFTGKAPELDAVQVTEENVEELATWMGASSYSIEKTLVGGERRVFFTKEHRTDRQAHPAHLQNLVRTRIGDWIVKIPEQILNENSNLYETGEKFRSYTQQQIDEFVKQQRDTGVIDVSAAPYDR